LHLLGVDAVGWESDIQAFKQKLEEVQAGRCRDPHEEMDPGPWQMDVAISLFWAIQQPDHTPWIGGRVQSMIITATGAQEQSFSVVREGGDPMNEADWEPVKQRLTEA
jgi:hypothetical protein